MSRVPTEPNMNDTQDLESEKNEIESALTDPAATEVSEEFVGRWQTLVSTTNWEKGRIIFEWRNALVETGSPSKCYSDDVWARRVGGVTAQHVGRLRRVFERFGSSYSTFKGVFWSHFLTALDWDDAEMWLEGATQSNWSVSEMREARWQAMGGDPAAKPQVEEIVGAEVDDDYSPLSELDDSADAMAKASMEADPDLQDRIGTDGPLNEGPDFGDEERASKSEDDDSDSESDTIEEDSLAPQSNPFADLPELPSDVADCVEQFKLSIVRHRAAEWADIRQEDMLRTLDALRLFVSHRAQ